MIIVLLVARGKRGYCHCEERVFGAYRQRHYIADSIDKRFYRFAAGKQSRSRFGSVKEYE